MSRMRRWKMSVTSWVDGVLAQIENHEATVSSAISRVRQSAARARVQVKRVERDQRELRVALATSAQGEVSQQIDYSRVEGK